MIFIKFYNLIYKYNFETSFKYNFKIIKFNKIAYGIFYSI